MKKVLLCLFLFSTFHLSSQYRKDNLWRRTANSKQSTRSIETKILKKGDFYELDLVSLSNRLKNTPNNRISTSNSKTIIHFPNQKGEIEAFHVVSTSALSKKLQLKYPQIKSYSGESLDTPNRKLYFSISPSTGLSATIFDANGNSSFISKSGTHYKLVSGGTISKEEREIKCNEHDHDHFSGNSFSNVKIKTKSNDTSENLKVFRIALMLSPDFSQEILKKLNIKDSASKIEKHAAIIGYLNGLITILNSIFERDVAITFQLIENNSKLIFLDNSKYNATSDLNANQKLFDKLIGKENYDIGHTLVLKNDKGVDGWAYVGSVGTPFKAGGFSTLGFNKGLAILAHEIGHQFGASHTHNNIPGKLHQRKTSVEVGRGKTIMSYGQVYPLFFHSVSIREITNFINTKVKNIRTIKTNNLKPIVNAGNNIFIPKQTPFILEGKVTNAETSSLSYSWEQVDTEVAIVPPSPFAKQGPLFEWTLPRKEPSRFFPNLKTILSGKTKNSNEALPKVSRKLNFTLIARDNNNQGGKTGEDKIKVTVDESTGPFQITSQNERTKWYVNEEVTLNWDVANTDKGNINTPLVDIVFSKDGGQNFPIKIASAIPNNGSCKIKVSAEMETTKGRFMIRGHKHIFLDINNSNITVKPTNFSINLTENKKEVCLKSTTTTAYEFTYETYSNFTETVNFSASELKGTKITFIPSSASKNGTKVLLKIENLTTSTIGKHQVKITASSLIQTYSKKIELNVFGDVTAPDLVSPENEMLIANTAPILKWSKVANAESYLIEIAQNKLFSHIVESKNTTAISFSPLHLKTNTTYYWRVKATTPCTEGNYSTTNQFTTTSNYKRETYIPDNNFEKALIDLGIDKGKPNNYVATKNVETLKELKVNNYGIQNLTGIQDFKNLEVLYVTNVSTKQKLKQVNLSKNNNLRIVNLSYNKLKNLDLRNLTKLEVLVCNQNSLGKIELQNNTNIRYLSCFGNQLNPCSLDNIFQALPIRKTKGEIYLKRYQMSNPGAATSTTDILDPKNWRATKYENNTYSNFWGNGKGCNNHRPTANAGSPQKVIENSKVILDASSSNDLDGDSLSYLWTAPSGISLMNAYSVKPYFIAPKVSKPTLYIFNLIVSDEKSKSEPVSIGITVLPHKEKPTINFDGDTFTIRAEGPACPESAEGVVTLTNNSAYDFSVTINKHTKTIKGKKTGIFKNLTHGSYPIIFTLANDTTQKIRDYKVSVPKPKMFSIKKQQADANIRTASYLVKGSKEYTLDINNRREIIAFSNEEAHLITIQLPKQKSFVRIAPSSSCKGKPYEELVVFEEKIKIYPRVSRDFIYVDGLNSKEVVITLVTRYGKTVFKERKSTIAGKCVFNISNLADNIYFLNIQGEHEIKTTFIYKRTFQ